jgi:hypothetical protein
VKSETATTSSCARNVVNRNAAAPKRPSRRQFCTTFVMSDPTALAIVWTSGAKPASRAERTASITTFACGTRYMARQVVGTGSDSSSTSRPVSPARCRPSGTR